MADGEVRGVAVEDEVDALFPVEKMVHVAGKVGSVTITVKPLLTRQAARVLKTLKSIVTDWDAASGATTVQSLLLHYPDEMVAMVAAAIDRDEEFVGDLRVDDSLKLAIAVVEINLPFFVNEIVPMFAKAMAQFTENVPGLKLSSDLSTAAMTPPPSGTTP